MRPKMIARLLAGLFLLFASALPAAAQWQVPNHYVPIGRGPGVVGFNSAAVGTAGRLLIDQGPSADPSFEAMSGDCTLALDGVITCAASGGTVTDVSVATANGFAGTVATSTSTPAITISTTVTGIIEGNGTAISAASTTGSGDVVLATSPTLVTPALGTPASGTLTNATGLPIDGGTTGTLPETRGGTNQTTYTTGDILYATGADTLGKLGVGSNTEVLTLAGGVPTWAAPAAGGGTVTNGSNLADNAMVIGDGGTTGVQTVAGLVTDGVSTITLGESGTSAGAAIFANATSGSITLSPPAGALGSSVLSLPAATDTLVGKATTDTLTNKTFDTAGTGNSFAINGTGITAVTGTGSVVLATSPTLVTPTLGAASATSVSIGGIPVFTGIPQLSKSADYTLVIGDAQYHILHPTADDNPRTFTIPANASVAYPIGTVITFVNQINTVTIAITSDTLTLAGTGATGSRTLAASGLATALKITSTAWVISGAGLT